MSTFFDKYMKLFAGPFKKYNLEEFIKNKFVEKGDEPDRLSTLNFFNKAFQDSIIHLSPQMTTESELYAMKTELLNWCLTIERQLLHKKANELRSQYLESWIISTKLTHNGEGWLRTNFATCCFECYNAHRIYLEFEEALNLKLFPFEKCTNRSGCICAYVWKSKNEPIAKHPWFPNEKNWREGS